MSNIYMFNYEKGKVKDSVSEKIFSCLWITQANSLKFSPDEMTKPENVKIFMKIHFQARFCVIGRQPTCR